MIESELFLNVGDYLFIEKKDEKDGSMRAELINGKKGLVHSNFVERINFNENLNKILQNLPKGKFRHRI